MGHSPKVLAPEEEKRVVEDLRAGWRRHEIRASELGEKLRLSTSIRECEDRYLVTELREKARTAGLSPTGSKDQLCLRLIKAGIIS